MCITDKELILNFPNDTIMEGVKIIFGDEFLQHLCNLYAEDIVDEKISNIDKSQNDMETDFTNNLLDEENIEI